MDNLSILDHHNRAAGTLRIRCHQSIYIGGGSASSFPWHSFFFYSFNFCLIVRYQAAGKDEDHEQGH
jgi:hypothetical protein